MATVQACLNRAESKALPAEFDEHIRKEGHKSNLKNMIGPVAIAKMQIHSITKAESQIT